MRCNTGSAVRAAVAMAAMVSLCASAAVADDLIVPGEYPSIQAAIDAAAEGDVVILQPGVYNETFNYNGKGIAVRSAEGPLVTRIDRNGAGGNIVTASGVPEGAVLEGIGFYRSGSNGLYMNGGTLVLTGCRFVGCSTGMYVESGADVTLFDTQVTSCTTGLVINGANIDMTACAFRNNTRRAGHSNGGTISATESEFTDNLISGGDGSNTQGGGGCWRADGSIMAFSKCLFARNRRDTYSTSSSYYYHGGCFLLRGGEADFSECRFEDNSSDDYRGRGGSIAAINGADLSVSECMFLRERNTRSYSGNFAGSLYIESSVCAIGHCAFEECRTTGGSAGGAIFVSGSSDVALDHVDFLACGSNGGACNGSAIYLSQSNDANSRFLMQQCEIRDAVQQGSGGVYLESCGVAEIRGSLFQGNSGSGYGGAINCSGLWSNGAGFAFEDNDIIDCGATELGGAIYLSSGFDGFPISIQRSRFINNSASQYGGAICFDQLDAAGTDIVLRDCSFEGNRAPTRGGAIYCLNTELLVLDCGFFGNDGDSNNNDNPNDNEYPGDAFWINNTSRIPILVNNAFCGTRLDELVGPWIDKGGNLFEANCEFDCDSDGLPDDYEIEVGLSLDCNGNGLPDECEIDQGLDGDCNGDGRLDSCEVEIDGAADCDGNLVPDACQSDCDGDALPDVCEIADGAADCDGDGVPDLCQIAEGSVPDANNDQVLDTCQVLDFAGLSTEIVLIEDRILDTMIPSTAVCYRLYADLNDPMASVTGVFGDVEHPLQLSSPAGFWQDVLGGDIPSSIPCDPMPDYPDLRYDSWLAIGLDCQDDNLVQEIGIDFGAFNKGGSLTADDGIVFVNPGDAQGLPIEGRVLIAQLTTVDGSLPQGEVNLLGSNADGSEWFAYAVTWPEAPLVDCNGNGVHDAYDLSNGSSRDCDGSGLPDECEFESIIDCNGNGISDLCDVADGTSGDADGDLVPDECECYGDANRDGVVNVYDVIAVIVHWGESGNQDADVNGDLVVDGGDLAAVLAGYGNCL